VKQAVTPTAKKTPPHKEAEEGTLFVDVVVDGRNSAVDLLLHQLRRRGGGEAR